MVKHPVTCQLPYDAIRTLNIMSDSLMKSKNWVLEHSVFSFGEKVDKFLSVDEDFRDYLRVKRNMWKDDLLSEQLRFYLRKGFILKNAIRKIMEMITSGVNQSHVIKAINVYEKLCNDDEYKEILAEIKFGYMNRKVLDIDRIMDKLNEHKKEGIAYVSKI